jgi:hypothetical protein
MFQHKIRKFFVSYKGAQHPTSGLMLPSLVLLGLHWFTEEDENENENEKERNMSSNCV